VKLIIQKGAASKDEEVTVGYRTVEGTAEAGKNFNHVDNIITLKRDQE